MYEGVVLRRAVAYVVDVVLLAGPLVVAHVVGAALGFFTFGLVSPLVALALPLLPVAYDALLIGGPGSATLGMRLLDIELRTLDGSRPGPALAALWSVTFEASVLVTGWLILALPLFNARRRTLHDFLCGLVMVRRGAGGRETAWSESRSL